jgi:hypothetical protein
MRTKVQSENPKIEGKRSHGHLGVGRSKNTREEITWATRSRKIQNRMEEITWAPRSRKILKQKGRDHLGT